jgi:Putative prokaryotic signal transducing protein/zinc-ribbon domain
MKNCAYCGKENDDEAVYCRECGTEEFQKPAAAEKPAEPPTPEPKPTSAKLEFMTPTPQEMEADLVNLIRCRTLGEADLLVAQLETAGIPAFIPDQFLMQNIAFNLNAYGYVRVQVSPKDYAAAKELLLGPEQNAFHLN